uniref:Uncharacterized protein n=1 Tax=Vespula pensylvanica TaxID=30213 RepID=A0A834P1Y3_VESPE|nr:hypothetical protein H0235_007801 [Vespula pensylvanica]
MQIELVVINELELDTHERMRQHLVLACVAAPKRVRKVLCERPKFIGRQSGVVGMPTTKYFGEASFMQTTLRACNSFEMLFNGPHGSGDIVRNTSLRLPTANLTDTVWKDNQYPRWYNRDVVRSYGKEHKDYTIIAIGSTGASYFVYPTVRLEIG